MKDARTLHWVSYYESFAVEEERNLKSSQDARFQELVENVREFLDIYNSEWQHYTVVE